MTALDLANNLRAAHPVDCSEPTEFRGEVSLTLSLPSSIQAVCTTAKTDLGFDYLVDITSIDNYGEDPRFSVVYHLYGLGHRHYLRLKTSVSEEVGEVPSVTAIWKTADWHEREIYDMMGIRFAGHPDLRRILMWEGYPFFPLRKDFPLAGKPSNLPEVAFSQQAPLEGGPFVTVAGGRDTIAREPRVRLPESDALESNARVERRMDNRETHGDPQGPGPIRKGE